MKKVVVLLLCFFLMSSVSAEEYGEWILKDDNMQDDAEIEYRYRFYKENKIGKYLSNSDKEVKNYKYKDSNNLDYSSYSEWLDNCEVDKNDYDIQKADVNVYQKVLPVRFIMISGINDDVSLLSIKIYSGKRLVNYQFLSCANCYVDKSSKIQDKIIKVQLDEFIDLEDLEVEIVFGKDVNYELKMSNDANFDVGFLRGIVSNNGVVELSELWLEDAIYGNNYYSLEEDNSIFVKKVGTVSKCRYRLIKPFYYNLYRVYYDDNYHTNVLGYKKDINDYQVFYRNKINKSSSNNLLSDNDVSDNRYVSIIKNDEVKDKESKDLKKDIKSDKADSKLKKDGELVNTLSISKNNTIIKYIILIVIGLTIIYIIYVNRRDGVKKCR